MLNLAEGSGRRWHMRRSTSWDANAKQFATIACGPAFPARALAALRLLVRRRYEVVQLADARVLQVRNG